MNAESISLARVLELNVPISWPEAVAVAIEASKAAGDGSRAARLNNCLLTHDGQLQVTGASVDDQTAYDSLLSLVKTLFQVSGAPAQELRYLEQLITPAPGTNGSIERINRALAFFAPPAPALDMRALADRSFTAVGSDNPVTQLARQLAGAARVSRAVPKARSLIAMPLRAVLKRLRAAQTAPADVDPATVVPKKRWIPQLPRQRAVRAAGALAVVSAAGAIAYILWRDTPAASTAEPIERSALSTAFSKGAGQIADATARVVGVLDKIGDAGLRLVGLSASVAPESPATTERPKRSPAPPARKPAGPPGEKPLLVELLHPAPPSESMADSKVSRDQMPPAESLLAAPGESGPNSEVVPPVLLRPQLRSDLPEAVLASGVGYFDVRVDERGQVVSVRLYSPRERFHDRMLLSAVKAWQFHPAMKDGRPVPYYLRIHIPE